MKGLVELSNFAVGSVSTKCTTLTETKGKVEDTPKMNWQCMGKIFKFKFSK